MQDSLHHDLAQIAFQPASPSECCATARGRAPAIWLQCVTIAWMLVEFGVAAYAAFTAHSTAMLAFGSDSLVELLSATVVLLQWTPRWSISQHKAARTAAILLFVLAGVVAFLAIASLALRLRPEVSCSGIGIALAALGAMPVLAWLKRREARRTGNTALAADAAQSAACAYLALIALAGLTLNAWFHLAWFDSAAALLAVPVLIREGRSAWQGKTCTCC